MRRITNNKFIRNIHLLILFISILSILLFKYPYISIIITIISLILSFIYSKRNKIILIITIFISTIMIIINSISIYNNYKKNIDIFKDENILLGSWTYNEYGGKYTFNNDNTYIQYTNESTEDNYCKGTYKYNYGASNKDITIRQDDNYYYYTLTLKEEYCLIMNKEFYDEYTKIMYLGMEKTNNNKLKMINKENNNIINLTKIENK